jgi:hypothetical protein
MLTFAPALEKSSSLKKMMSKRNLSMIIDGKAIEVLIA